MTGNDRPLPISPGTPNQHPEASAERILTNLTDLLEELVHYFKYASSAYSPICLRPNGNHLVLAVREFREAL